MNIAQMSPDRLPQPDAESRARSERLVDHIRSEMETCSGHLGFARYMDLVLNAPGLGYYRASDGQFGLEGDFVTAPDLSPLFARCVASQTGQILEHLGGGDVFEAGAGSGTLCAGLLNALDDLDRGPSRYLILEPSAALRQRQRESIERKAPRHISRVDWVDDLPAEGFVGVILCNELLDAIPAPRFRKNGNQVLEAFVCERDGGFDWCYGAPEYEGMIEAVTRIEAELGEPFTEGYTSELGSAREAWLSTAAQRLHRGAVLLLDYGHTLSEYYHPQRRDGTLACYYRHRVHADPFLWPGLQDISVHVEFSGLCRAAKAAGLEVAGFTTQAEFLIASGLLDACRELDPGSLEFVRFANQIKRLTLPGEMGQLVKVLALSRGVDCPLAGFSGRDYCGRL
jgi:SAM-dependent MidA family methyltransferase